MRIVGIDWGTSSIKAVEIDSAFGRYDIHDYREVEITPELPAAEAARRLVESFSQTPHRVVVSMKSSLVTTRNLHLPTRDKKAIQSGVPFQLEEELPFAIDDMAYDSSILSQVGQQSDVHVATTLKKHLAAEISKWGDIGIDPDVVTTEGWALRTLVNRTFSPAIQDKPLLLVYIGATSTLLYLHWRGFPMVCREIRWGGHTLTNHLARKLGLSFEQAERTKKDPSVLQESHALGLIEILGDAFEDLQREIKHMDLVCKGVTHETLQSIHLLGGGSLIPGLPEMLAKKISITVERINPLSALSPSGVTFAETTDAKMGVAASLAMTLVGADKNVVINLRRGEFSKASKGLEFNLQSIQKPLAAIGAISASFFISMGVQHSIYQKRLEDKDTQLKRAMSGFFGSVSNSALRTYLGNPASLKSAIQKELDKNRELARIFGPNTASPTDYLKNLSVSIPKDVVVDLMNVQVGAAPDASGDSPIELKFTSADPTAADRLAKLLAPKLLDSSKPTLEEIPAQGKEPKKYRITLKGKAGPGGFVHE